MLKSPRLDSQEIHRPGNFAAWLLLALAAGLVNAIAFVECERFVSHVTGLITQAGIEPWLVVECGVLFVTFVAGGAAAIWIAEGPRFQRIAGRPILPLLLTAALLATASVLGAAGVFGTFGSGLEEQGDLAFLAMLALAMGVQNAAVANATGMVVRTTHLTGSATDLGIALGTLAQRHLPDDARRAARRSARLRAGKIASFMTGALFGLVIAKPLAFLSLLVPAGLIAATAGIAYLRPARARRELHERRHPA